VLFTCLFRPSLGYELSQDEVAAPEPVPGIAPEPSPEPSPAPPFYGVPDYLFDTINQSYLVGARYEAVIGSSSDFMSIYVLGGSNQSSSSYATSSYVFDLSKKNWTDLQIPFSRKGACSAQDGNRNGLWIFGGDPSGTNNTATFLQFTFSSKAFAVLANPSQGAKTGVSCAVSNDGTNFYVLFGELSRDENDQVDNCSSLVGVFNVANNNWTYPHQNGSAPARVGGSAFMYGNSIVVYGGMCGTTYLGDVYRLDTTSFT